MHTLEFLLSQKINSEILISLIENPKTPIAAIEKNTIDLITQYSSSKINFSNISHLFSLLDQRISITSLLNHNKSQDWIRRYAVAINSNTPVDILQKLAKDKHCLVQLSANENIQLQAGALFKPVIVKSPSTSYE